MNSVGLVLTALVIAIGLVGILVPLLPGTLLIFAAVVVWAVVEQRVAAWIALCLATAVLSGSVVIKYLWPVRRIRAAEVGRWTVVVGSVVGVFGFFVVPVVGLVLGFVLGIFGAEVLARRNPKLAWSSTVQAAKAVALSVGVEFVGGLIAAVIWLTAALSH